MLIYDKETESVLLKVAELPPSLRGVLMDLSKGVRGEFVSPLQLQGILGEDCYDERWFYILGLAGGIIHTLTALEEKRIGPGRYDLVGERENENG